MHPLAELLAQDGTLRRIFFRQLALSCSIGIHASERAGPQRLLVDVDIYLGSAPRRDDIAEVLDYDIVRREITALAASRHFNLQETFVQEALDLCLALPGVTAARVASAKPDVYANCAEVGYEAMRIKSVGGRAGRPPG